MERGETTEQYGLGDLSGAWVTGIELVLSSKQQWLETRALSRPQVGLGGPGSDWEIDPNLPCNLWKFVYRAGKLYFVSTDRASGGVINGGGPPTVYSEINDQDQIQLGDFSLKVQGVSEALAFLEGYTDPHLSARWVLNGQEVLLGRSDTPIQLDDPTVSRVHASIQRCDQEFTVCARSQNSATRLNGVLLVPGQPQTLQNGDMLNLGRQVLRFVHPERVANHNTGLKVCTLGRFEVLLAGQPIENDLWQGPQVQYALAYLCAHRRGPCSEERLLDQLWMGEEVSKKRLHNVLSLLRSMLRPLSTDPILRTPAGIRLNPALPLWHDVEELRKILQQPPRSSNPGCSQSINDLYRGPYLPGCSQAWAELMRSQLESQTVDYLSQLAQALLTDQKHIEAVRAAEQAIGHDPLAQEAYVVMLRGLLALGKAREALRYYELISTQLQRARLPQDPRLAEIYGLTS